jgi:hypothetical protein
MDTILTILGVFLMIVGFWALLNSFDKTGQERAYRMRVSIGSIIVGLGNVLFTNAPGFGIMLILIGGLVAVTAKRPER